uniref:EGF-like domain-containing protein n=1 Tax=Setaria digitata TaxID=48799 RepID=A0A915PZT7_9BILA
MSDNTPYYCFPTESVHCPDNYACSQAVNHFGTYVCCSELSATIPHSINLTPALDENGDKIYCTPNNPLTCPANTICIKSANSPDEYFCCDSSSSHKICPDNQVASVLPNGQLEVCIGAGASCSQIGYTCQISLELFTWVCCGYSTAMAVCLDGRETFYETEGMKITTSFTSTLSVLSRRKSKARTKTTPKSSNTVATTATTTMITSTLGTTVKPECPFAWHPYVAYQTGDNQFCSSITDKSCPSGYSCTHSTHHGIYMCCRFGSGLQCATGTNILLVNNRPRLCTVTGANICPVGYSCQISTLENIYICCGDIQIEDERTIIRPFGNHIRCKNDLSIPALIYNHYIRFCSTVGSYNECPNGYICSNSNQTNVNVCCRTVLSGLLIIKVEPEEAFCGENAFPYHENGNPLECSDDKDNICPECPSGVIPNFPKYCQHLDDCQLDEECEEAKNMNGIHICCPKTIQNRTRCLGRETFLTDAVPVSCSSTTNCPDDYECSNLTTTNDYACCMKESKLMQICPDNRDPYRKFMDDGPLYCDKNDFTCPKGYLCKQSLLNGRFICCSPIGFCQLGKLPQLDSDTNQAKRCFTEFDDNSTYSNACKEGFTCQQSTVKYLRVCCDSSNNTANHHFNVKSKS